MMGCRNDRQVPVKDFAFTERAGINPPLQFLWLRIVRFYSVITVIIIERNLLFVKKDSVYISKIMHDS